MEKNYKVQIVGDDDWTEVCALLVDSLCDLNFYKDIEPNSDLRSQFLKRYLEEQYHRSRKQHATEFFWCLKRLENPCHCFDLTATNHHEGRHCELVMAAKLALPRGFAIRIPADLHECSSGLITKGKYEEMPSFSAEMKSKFPQACSKMRSYTEWFKELIQQFSEVENTGFWQGSHISVVPEYRMRGISAEGLKAATRHFSPLAAATEQLMVISTGVKICRFLCKNAGFRDLRTGNYQSRTRWLMLLDMRDITSTETGHTEAFLRKITRLNDCIC